jgi:large subunit ribosomal protein L22
VESYALTKYVRISPLKMRSIARQLRGQVVSSAIAVLEHMPHKGATIIKKTVMSASSNAVVMNPDINTDDLFIKELLIDQGPVLKRVKPRARGRADRVAKRTSHVKVVLTDVKS